MSPTALGFSPRWGAKSEDWIRDLRVLFRNALPLSIKGERAVKPPLFCPLHRFLLRFLIEPIFQNRQQLFGANSGALHFLAVGYPPCLPQVTYFRETICKLTQPHLSSHIQFPAFISPSAFLEPYVASLKVSLCISGLLPYMTFLISLSYLSFFSQKLISFCGLFLD